MNYGTIMCSYQNYNGNSNDNSNINSNGNSNINSNINSNQRCTNIGYYTEYGHRSENVFCYYHKNDKMALIFSPVCRATGCYAPAKFGIRATLRETGDFAPPLYCSAHKLTGMRYTLLNTCRYSELNSNNIVERCCYNTAKFGLVGSGINTHCTQHKDEYMVENPRFETPAYLEQCIYCEEYSRFVQDKLCYDCYKMFSTINSNYSVTNNIKN